MAIVLDHTIVPAHDNVASARFFARIFGLPYEGAMDIAGSMNVTFKADLIGTPSDFRGFYDFSLDANGNPSSAITGTITGGHGTFRGATGSFQVLNRVITTPEKSAYTAHWRGSIRY